MNVILLEQHLGLLGDGAPLCQGQFTPTAQEGFQILNGAQYLGGSASGFSQQKFSALWDGDLLPYSGGNPFFTNSGKLRAATRLRKWAESSATVMPSSFIGSTKLPKAASLGEGIEAVLFKVQYHLPGHTGWVCTAAKQAHGEGIIKLFRQGR
jgi:hypothetical protein